jgi:hypothetical protein
MQGLLDVLQSSFESAREKVREHFASLSRLFDWQGDWKRARRRLQPYRRRLGFESLERKQFLSAITLVPGSYAPGGIDTITSDPYITNFVDANNSPVALGPDAEVIIPAGTSSTINIADAGLPDITFKSLECQAGVTIAPATSSDVIKIDPQYPMTVKVDNSTDTVTIATAIAPPATGTTTLLKTTGNTGVVELTGALNVTTINANAGKLVLDAGASVTADTINVNAGTFDCEGSVTVNTALKILGDAVLQSDSSTATIALNTAAAKLLYQTTASCNLHAAISGAGFLDAFPSSGATLALYNAA